MVFEQLNSNTFPSLISSYSIFSLHFSFIFILHFHLPWYQFIPFPLSIFPSSFSSSLISNHPIFHLHFQFFHPCKSNPSHFPLIFIRPFCFQDEPIPIHFPEFQPWTLLMKKSIHFPVCNPCIFRLDISMDSFIWFPIFNLFFYFGYINVLGMDLFFFLWNVRILWFFFDFGYIKFLSIDLFFLVRIFLWFLLFWVYWSFRNGFIFLLMEGSN